MEPGTIIILFTLGLFLATIVWWIFRIARFKKRRDEIDRLSMEIADLEGKKAPASKGPHSPKLPEEDLLLILHRNGNRPWKGAFRDAVESGKRAMIVTARNPREVRSQYRGDYGLVWLNRSVAHKPQNGVRVVNPTNLSGIVDEADQYFKNGGVLLLDGFDEMMHANEIGRIMRFLRTMQGRAGDMNVSVIAPLNYRATPQRIRNQLTESFEVVVI